MADPSSVTMTINEAMSTMRGSMAMLAERDVKLHNLQDKSDSLQGTSGAFVRQAKRLQWEMRWQRCRIFFMVVALMLWGVGFYLFQGHVPAYVAASSIAFTVLFVVQRYVLNRWSSESKLQDMRELLGPLDSCEA